MFQFVIFLRGINVGGGTKNKIRMADLKSLINSLSGYENIVTYLQTGNILLRTLFEKEKVESDLNDAIETKYGTHIDMIIYSPQELMRIHANNPFTIAGGDDEEEVKLKSSYYILLKTIPERELREEMSLLSSNKEEFYIYDDCIYLYCQDGYGRAKFTNNYFEKKLKIIATTRGFNTIQKMIEISS